MVTLVLAQLRRRPGRSLALLLGILVAVAGFTVLTASSDTSRLRVVGTVRQHYRSSYDILVRPKGSTTAVERASGRVRPNFLSGIYGGISLDEYRRIKGIAGVQVAAPIAMVGYILPHPWLGMDLGPVPASGRSLLRVSTTWSADRGLTKVDSPNFYLYTTSQALWPDAHGEMTASGLPLYEQTGTGGSVRVCPAGAEPPSPFRTGVNVICWSTQTGFFGLGQDSGIPGVPAGHLGYELSWPMPFVLAAVDPEQEAKLDGLNRAVVSGTYLPENPPAGKTASEGPPKIPVIATSRPYDDRSASLTVSRLPDSAATPAQAALPMAQARVHWDALAGTPVQTRSFTEEDAYRQFAGGLQQCHVTADSYWTAGPTTYRPGPNGSLTPGAVTNPLGTWSSQVQGGGFNYIPPTADDTQFRRLGNHVGSNISESHTSPFPQLCSTGTFEPTKLAGFDPVSQVPMETYNPPTATPRDPRTRALLHGQDLVPDGNPAGYLQQPPFLLTTLDSLPALTNSEEYTDTAAQEAAPISVIRVRVSGVHGPDALSRERVRAVAQQITRRTGLDVDVTIGSSPSPTAIDLPAGRHGRPVLALTEGWTRKGVAVAIIKAIDQKSLILFVLILVVCALFVGNASGAAVRSRRTELGVLACVGWSRPRLFGVVLGELTLVGVAAGLLGFGIAVPAGAAAGLHVSVGHALLAVPAAVLLALLSGLVPARQAARADPLAAVRPAVLVGRRSRLRGGVPGLGLANLARVPGRTALGALSLAIGVAALTLLSAVTLAFHGVLVGSLLGDAVTVQVRGVDYVAVGATLLLAAIAVADVQYLNVRDRLAEFATLRATGWSERAMARLVFSEGVALGVLGALAGAALGVGVAATFAGTVNATVIAVGAGAALLGGLVATAGTVVPAVLLRRLPTAATLAEE